METDISDVKASHTAQLNVHHQRLALRSQLFFRKHVLQQEDPSSVFTLSAGGKQHSVDQLLANLLTFL